MRGQNWTDVMTLLAVMVASSDMDKEAELSTFRQAAINLRDLYAPHIKLTESFAADWMNENQSKVKSQASSVHFDNSIKALRKKLDFLPHKEDILTTIMKWTMSEEPKATLGQLKIKRIKNKETSNAA